MTVLPFATQINNAGAAIEANSPIEGEVIFCVRLILGFRVLADEPTDATIGLMFGTRSCLSLKAFGWFDGGHRPSAGTEHDFTADDQSGHFDR
jgi:hypothetical protein